MTTAEFERLKKAIDDYTREITRSPEAARDALAEMGIYTADGKLAPEYGGPPAPKKKDRAA